MSSLPLPLTQIMEFRNWTEDSDCGNDKLPVYSKLVRNLLLQLDAYNSDEILLRVVKEFVWWEISSQDLCQFFFSSFGIFESILLKSAFHIEV